MGKKDKSEKKSRRDSLKAEKKVKKEKREKSSVDVSSAQLYLSPIASPMAGDDLREKLLKLTTKATKDKQVRRGVKEVVKALRKQHKGLCLIAGDISPVDVITHLPVLCSEADVPFAFVPSKEQLGLASRTKRPTSCVLITGSKDADYADLFKKCKSQVSALA